jgi:hypothetical protein
VLTEITYAAPMRRWLWLAVWCAACAPPMVPPQPTVQEQLHRALGEISAYCGQDNVCARTMLEGYLAILHEQVDQPPVVYQPVPVYQPQPIQRPSVVLPGNSNFPLQPGAVPGTYYQPGPGGPRWYNIQRVP